MFGKLSLFAQLVNTLRAFLNSADSEIDLGGVRVARR